MNNKTDQPSLRCEAIARAALGQSLKIHGQELYWRCLNHDDRAPSLQINAEKNVWMCGPCGASGNPWELAAFLARVQPND